MRPYVRSLEVVPSDGPKTVQQIHRITINLDVKDGISLDVEMPWKKKMEKIEEACGSEPRIARIRIGKPNDKPYQSLAEVGGFRFATSYIAGTRE